MAYSNICSVIFLIVVVFVIFNSPSTTPSTVDESLFNTAVAREKAYLNVLNSSIYGDFVPSVDQDNPGKWLNLTGLRQVDSYTWDLMAPVQQKAREQLQYIGGAEGAGLLNENSQSPLRFYHNVTGFLNGRWTNLHLIDQKSRTPLNLSAVAPESAYDLSSYDRNLTGTGGKVQLKLLEKDLPERSIDDGKVRALSATFTIQDDSSSGDGWDITLHGVHFRDVGSAIMTTTSDKFAGIFALPHFALSQQNFNTSRFLLNQTINDIIQQQESDHERKELPLNPWSSTISSADGASSVPKCEFVVYLQQLPVDEPATTSSERKALITNDMLREIEDDLRNPMGKFFPAVPELRMSMVGFSPDCGWAIQSEGPPDITQMDTMHLTGMKMEVLIGDSKYMMNLFCLILLGQLWSYIWEIKDCSSPSARSRISFFTLAMLSLGGGLVCLVFLFLACFVESILVPALIVAFMASLQGNFFDIRFMKEVWTTQSPERREHQQLQREQYATAPVRPVSDSDSLPLPVTASQPVDSGATPIPIPPTTTSTATTTPANPLPAAQTPANSTSDSFESLYLRFYMILLVIFFLSTFAATWPLTLRTVYANLLSYIYLSFWTPQIYRNIIRNCRKALSWRFVLTQSFLRLLPFGYFWCIPNNVLSVENDRLMFLGMLAWVGVQISLLAGQEHLGPRFLVKETWSWVPLVWNYHPILREDEEGATLPVGFNVESHPNSPTGIANNETGQMGQEKGRKVYDCAICMQHLEVRVLPPDGTDQEESVTSSLLGNSRGNGSGSSGGDSGSSSSSIRNSRFILNTKTAAARHEYMVTPCRHIFHTTCLEAWIEYRLQCPICRDTLPPI